MKIVLWISRNFTIIVYLAYWRSETDWNITILILIGYRQLFLHNLWKFGEIRIKYSIVLSERSCTAGVDTAKISLSHRISQQRSEPIFTHV